MKKALLLAASLMASLACPAYAGSSAGNGTDIHGPYFYHAWFGGMARARYCMFVSPEFGVEGPRLSGAVEWAFSRWSAYLGEKHLDVRVAKALDSMPACDGTEDLRVYFGMADQKIDEIKSHYSQPIAFAEKTEYDPKTGKGRGVLWLSLPKTFESGRLDWASPGVLHAILLHEMGHVFGNEHVDGTIMDKEIGYRVLGGGSQSGAAMNLPLETIDGRHRELVSCRDCIYEFNDIGHAQLTTRFEKLTGRLPLGNVKATAILEEGRVKRGTLRLTDQRGEIEFRFQAEKEIVWRNGDATAFRTSISSSGTGTGVYFGWLTGPTGKRLPISLSRNMSYGMELVDLDGKVRADREDDSDFFHGHDFKILR